MTDNDMTQMVLDYQRDPTKENGNRLGMAFGYLVDNIIKVVGAENQMQMRGEKKDIIFTCFDRIERFSPDKGTAFNYFCTIVLNQMRKAHRDWKDGLRKEAKYGDFFAAGQQAVDKAMTMFESGAITQIDLFARLSDMEVSFLPKYQKEYDEWLASHPPGERLRTFSITA